MKRLSGFLALFLVASLLLAQDTVIVARHRGQAGGQTLLDSDDFTGTAGANLHTYDANWVLAGSAWCTDLKISAPTNGGVGTGSGGPGLSCTYRTGKTWTNDQYAQLTVVALPTGGSGVCVRVSIDGTNKMQGYCLATTQANSDYRLLKYTAGNQVTLFDYTSNIMTTTDIINLQIIGTTLTPKVNGIVLATQTDTTWSTGSPGIVVTDGTTGKKIFSTWSAGSAQ